ncbi:MAG: putative bifunctional diguanylate cyclase/phosphodiesterase [Actinomycetota bacterium]
MPPTSGREPPSLPSGAPRVARPDDPALRELVQRYRDLMGELPGAIYVESPAIGRMLDISEEIERLTGYPADAWRADSELWRTIVHPDDVARIETANEACAAHGVPFEETYRARTRDGRDVHIAERSVLVSDPDGAPRYWLGMMVDVTQAIEARDTLTETQAKYGALVEQIPAIVYVDRADAWMQTTYVSPQIERILGVSPQEYMDDSDLWTQMLHPDDRETALEVYERGRATGEPFTFEYRLVARDGRVVWFQDSALVLRDAQGRPSLIQGVMLDISIRKEAEQRLAYLAYHDHLTGMANKPMFDELLDRALARAHRSGLGVAVLALDVDEFKLVNDSLGHEAGDRLIAMLAERIAEATRETDLIARQGGDEFLVLIADVDLDGASGEDAAALAAQAVAARVQESLEAPFDVDGTELYVTVSIGISTFPADGQDAGGLLRNADTAMFRAKSAGPGLCVVHQADDVDAFSRLSLSTRLRKAVEQKSWALHYQPLVNLLNGEMVGVEALIRWPDPNGGLVPPMEFIPLAEEMGLIEAIGEWVIEEICRQDAAWRAEGLSLEIGFNLSPRELWQADPVERIARLIASAGMDPTRVTIEITESTAMHDADRTIEILHRFHDQGLKLALDDFGTGYSSLARLRYMPVDILKVDRTFVRDVHEDPQSASMVSAMIALASNLGMTPLAEGIETEDEWRYLAGKGCPLGQGYFFSRPVPPEEILALHRRAGLTVIDGGLAAG